MADTLRTATPTTPDLASSPIQSVNAITLATHDMTRSVRFYRSLGFVMRYGGEGTDFTSFTVGSGHLNIVAAARRPAMTV